MKILRNKKSLRVHGVTVGKACDLNHKISGFETSFAPGEAGLERRRVRAQAGKAQETEKRAGPGGRSGPARSIAGEKTPYDAKSSSGCARDGCRSLDSDCFSSWRIRSRVSPRARPISSSVCGFPS